MDDADTQKSFRSRLRAREPMIGTFMKTPSPVVAELLASTELDMLCLDAEHAPFDRKDLDTAVLVCRGHRKPALVRVPSAAPEHILSALDMGADGIVVPHVSSAAIARDIVRAAHFGDGGRGYAGSTRAARYGRRPMAEHIHLSGEHTAIIAMIEDPGAVDTVEKIVAVEGIDALFVGRADLTVALGKTDLNDPAVVHAVDYVCRVADAAGRAVGMFLATPDDIPAWLAKGASYFLLESDQSFILRGASTLARRFAELRS